MTYPHGASPHLECACEEVSVVDLGAVERVAGEDGLNLCAAGRGKHAIGIYIVKPHTHEPDPE